MPGVRGCANGRATKDLSESRKEVTLSLDFFIKDNVSQ